MAAVATVGPSAERLLDELQQMPTHPPVVEGDIEEAAPKPEESRT
jgi:hypothetical protein